MPVLNPVSVIKPKPAIIYLIGMPGAGKTTLGPKLAARLNRPFYDLDAFIEAEQGVKVPALFAAVGEAGFREIETKALQTLTAQAGGAVVATGGGTPCFNQNMAFMQAHGLTVFLDVPVAQLVERLTRQGLKKRPLLAQKTKGELTRYLTEMYNQRKAFYQQARIITYQDEPVTSFLEKIFNALPAGA